MPPAPRPSPQTTDSYRKSLIDEPSVLPQNPCYAPLRGLIVVRPHVQKNRAHSHCSATDDSPKLLHLRRSIRRQRRFHQRLEQLQCRSIWLLAICISYHQVVVGIARAVFGPCRHCHLETQETAYHSCIGLHLYWHHSFVLVCIRSFIAYPRMRPNNSCMDSPCKQRTD